MMSMVLIMKSSRIHLHSCQRKVQCNALSGLTTLLYFLLAVVLRKQGAMQPIGLSTVRAVMLLPLTRQRCDIRVAMRVDSNAATVQRKIISLVDP